MSLQWFGPTAWSLHARENPELRVDIPVGAPCAYCGEPIEAGASGVVIVGAGIHHEECFLRPYTGGVLHQLGKCACPPELRGHAHGPPGFAESVVSTMTRREEAVMASALFREGREHWTPRDWFAAAQAVERGEHTS